MAKKYKISIMLKTFKTVAVVMLVAQSCLTLCNPMDYSLPGSSLHGILEARILEPGANSFSRGSSRIQGSNSGLLHCRQILYHLCQQGRFLKQW